MDLPPPRSSLYAWMDREWPILSRGGRMNWDWLMHKIAEYGLTDADGQAPTLRTAQQTLYRVRKAHKSAPPPPSKPPPPPPAPWRPSSGDIAFDFVKIKE